MSSWRFRFFKVTERSSGDSERAGVGALGGELGKVIGRQSGVVVSCWLASGLVATDGGVTAGAMTTGEEIALEGLSTFCRCRRRSALPRHRALRGRATGVDAFSLPDWAGVFDGRCRLLACLVCSKSWQKGWSGGRATCVIGWYLEVEPSMLSSDDCEPLSSLELMDLL